MNHTVSTVPIEFVRQLLDGPELDNSARLGFLSRAGIPADLLESRQARVTTDQFTALYRIMIIALNDESPGMFKQPLKRGTLKFLALGVVQCHNLVAALKHFCQYFRVVLDDLHFELKLTQCTVSVLLRPRSAEVAGNRFAQEVLLMLVQGMVSWLAGHKMPIVRLDLAYPVPGHASEYVLFFPGPAQFNQQVTAIHFDRNLLSSPVRQHPSTVQDFLAGAPKDWMFVSFAERIVSHHVREHLESQLTEDTTIQRVAADLLMSTRTLARRLHEEGTSFQAIKNELRRDVAIQLLTQTELPTAIISARIGFHDDTSFYRAFHRWTGSSPGVYRSGIN